MELKKILYILLLIYLNLSFINACGAQNNDPNVIAEIGDDYAISYMNIHEFYNNNYFDALYSSRELKGYEIALDILITNRLKQIDFFESGLHKDSTLIREIQRHISEELINEFIEKEFLSEYLNEASVREYYDGMKKEITYRQIVLRKSQGSSHDERKQIEEKIEDIQLALSEGENFETLVSIYSQDINSANKDGYVSPISYADRKSRSFFNQLYMLNEGDIKVLETGNAFYIITIEDIEKKEIEPLNQIRDKVVENLKNLYMEESNQEFNEYKEQLIDKGSFEWNEQGLEKIVDWANQEEFYAHYYKDTLQKELSQEKNEILLTYSGGKVDLREYLHLLNNVLIMQDSRNPTVDAHKNFIDEAVRLDLIVKQAKEMGLDRNIFHKNSLSNSLKNQTILLYNSEMIDSQVPEPTEVDLQTFYETHKDSLFYQLAKTNIYAIVYEDSIEASNAWKQIEQGKSFEELASGWAVKSFIKNRDGEIQPNNRQEVPYLGEAAFSIGEEETAGPVAFDHPEKGRQYAIIKNVDYRPEKQLSYDDVSDKIGQTYKEFHRKELVKSVKQELWEKYPVTIYWDRLRQKVVGSE